MLPLLTASILFSVFVTSVALLAEELSFRRYRGAGPAPRHVRPGRGEPRLPPAQRLVAAGPNTEAVRQSLP